MPVERRALRSPSNTGVKVRLPARHRGRLKRTHTGITIGGRPWPRKVRCSSSRERTAKASRSGPIATDSQAAARDAYSGADSHSSSMRRQHSSASSRLRRERRIPRSLTLSELVETYLAQHDVQPVTIEKLRWL